MKLHLITISALIIGLLSCQHSEKAFLTDRTTSKEASIEEAGNNYETDFVDDEQTTRNIPSTTQYKQRLIKNGHLVFKTDDLTRSRNSITKNLSKYGAFISNESLSETNWRSTQHISIQVPVDKFDELVNTIGNGVEQFDTKEIDVTDVSSEYYDTQARIKSKEKLEARMFEILKKAKTVKELLEIEYELSKLRTEIESMQGQLKYLSAKTSFSTINLEFYLEKEYKSNVKEKNRFVEGFINGWELILAFIIGLVNIWPFIILLTLGVFLFKRIMKKKKEQKIK